MKNRIGIDLLTIRRLSEGHVDVRKLLFNEGVKRMFKLSEEERKARGEEQRKWRSENREYYISRCRKYYQRIKNRVRLDPRTKIRRRLYHIKNPIPIKWRAINHRSKKHGMPLIMTKIEFTDWFNKQEQRCVYCGLVDLMLDVKSFRGEQHTFFTIDRKDSNLPYSTDNMVMSCLRCNRYKNDYFTHDEWKEIAEKYVRPKWLAKLGVINVSSNPA